MKKLILIAIVAVVAFGAFLVYKQSTTTESKVENLYSVTIDYNRDFYDVKVSGWGCRILARGAKSISVPIPDSVTFKWKTALPGGKEYYDNLDTFPKLNEDGTYPEVEMYPSDLFQDHEVAFDLRNKIPETFQGDIYFTVNAEDDIVLKYIEKQKAVGRSKYKQMDMYMVIIVNKSLSADIYATQSAGWPHAVFSGLPIKSGYLEKYWANTIPPRTAKISWKTALEGGKEYYDNFKEIIKKPSDTYKLERYPSDKFEEHDVEVEIDSDIIVKYGGGAKLIFYVFDNDRVEVEYRTQDGEILNK